MSDGSISISTELDDRDAQKKLNKLNAAIEKTQNAINKKSAEKSAITQELEKARTEAEETRRAIEDTRAALAQAQATSEAGFDVPFEEWSAAREKANDLTTQLNEQNTLYDQQNARVAELEAHEQTLTHEIAGQTDELKQAETEAGELARQMHEAAAPNLWESAKARAKELGDEFRKAGKKALLIGFGVAGAISIFRKLKTYIVDAVKAFAEYDSETKRNISGLKANLASLKAAWGAAFAPIFNAIAPAINYLIGLLIKAANAISQFMAVLGGKSSFQQYSEGLEDVTEGLEQTGGAAKEAKKYLSGLDEISTYSDNSGGGGGGGGGNLPAPEEVPTDEETGIGKLAAFVRENLESVMLVVDEFLFAIGLILMFTGHIPLGLALCVYAGYQGVKEITANWGEIKTQLQGEMGKVMAIVSGALLAIGIILMFAGVFPLGLGLTILGAAGLATVAAANWDYVKNQLWPKIQEIMAIVGGALTVIGAILCFTGFVSLGIPLLIAGLGLTAVGTDWDGLGEWFSSKFADAKKAVDNGMKKLKESLVLKVDTFKTWWNEKVKPWFTWDTWKEKVFQPLKKRLEELGIYMSNILKVDKIREWWREKVKPWFTWDTWKEKVFTPLKNRLEEFGKYMSNILKIDKIKEWWNDKVKPWFTAAKWQELASTAIQNLKNKLSFGGFSPIKDWWNNNVAPWFTANKWQELGRNAIDAIKKGLQNLPRFHLDFVTSTKTFTVLGRTITMNIPWPQLSFYARGGIVDGATLLGNNVVGEAGKEAIIPLERHTEWIKRVAEEIVGFIQPDLFPAGYPRPAMATGTQIPPRVLCTFEGYNLDDVIRRLDSLIQRQERPINFSGTFNAEVNGKTLFREVISQGRTAQKSSGKNPFDF